MEELNYYWEKGAELAMQILPALALAIFVLIVGFWVIRRLTRLVEKSLKRSNFSKEITPFVISFFNIALKVLLLLSVAGIIGIETASLVAVMAAAGFAVGLALQGSLSNFAAGIIILVFRPYKVDDWIEIDDKFGKVESIQIFNTVIVTPGAKTLIIPNGQVIDNIVTNYSSKGYIRMELEVTMPYEESFPKVKKIIEEVLRGIPAILQEPEPEVGIFDYDSHSIIVAVRPFVKPDDFWEVRFEAYQKIKAAFHQHSVKVAYSEGVELGRIGD
jgi:small conductance mechanosensitive channel